MDSSTRPHLASYLMCWINIHDGFLRHFSQSDDNKAAINISIPIPVVVAPTLNNNSAIMPPPLASVGYVLVADEPAEPGYQRRLHRPCTACIPFKELKDEIVALFKLRVLHAEDGLEGEYLALKLDAPAAY